jgi:phosphoglycolate phosphatase-like HAD superfamily hydrolase
VIVYLFDLDGTLCDTGGAGRRSMERAFDARYGTKEPMRGFGFGGLTDRLIARTALERFGAEASDRAIDELLSTYLEFLPDELERTQGYVVFPGVVRVLESLAGARGVAIGLGTGNVEPGARLKLGRGGLNAHFAFGGFGSDHEDRAELLRRGMERGAEKLGASPADVRTIVVGDTPRDVSAGHAIGAYVVAVTTGWTKADELARAGADLVLADLTLFDHDAVLSKMG